MEVDEETGQVKIIEYLCWCGSNLYQLKEESDTAFCTHCDRVCRKTNCSQCKEIKEFEVEDHG